MNAIIIAFLAFIVYTFSLIAENPQSKVVVKREQCQPVQCPVVPEEYYVVKTKEDMICQTSTGKSIVYKSIEQSRVER